MNLHLTKSYFDQEDFHVHFIYRNNPFSFVLRQMPSNDLPYWAMTIFHEFKETCPCCKKEGYYNEKEGGYTNLSLPCLYFDPMHTEILSELSGEIRLSILMKYQLDIKEIIHSFYERKNRFKS